MGRGRARSGLVNESSRCGQAVVDCRRTVRGLMPVRAPGLRATARRSLSLLTAALLVAGCVAPAAQVNQSASASAVASPSPSATPTTAPATPSPTLEPTPVPSQALGFQAPDGILPPNSIVVVAVDGLQLRAEPGLSAAVTGAAVAGDRFKVQGWFGPVERDGLQWYRLGPATVGDLDAWAAAGSGADRYLEVVPPSCPSGDPDLATVINVGNEWDRLACFGDRSLTLEGTFSCGVCDGTMAGDFEPFWLAWPLGGSFVWVEYPTGTGPDYREGIGPLTMRTPEDSGVELPVPGSIVRLTGHFSDPASTTCTVVTFIGEQATPVDQRTAELYCREQFVIDALEVIGTDPNYTDPYGG